MSVARVIPKRIRDQQDANMSPGAGTAGYAIVYNHGTGKFELGTFEAAGAVSAHVALSDPHEQYALESALGTAASYNVGTGANNIVQLDGSAKLPAVDGSQLTNLPGGAVAGSTTQVIFNDAGAYAGDAGLTYAKATDRLTVVGGIIAGDWSPPSDSTTAVSIWNAARSMRVATLDTVNQQMIVSRSGSDSAYQPLLVLRHITSSTPGDTFGSAIQFKQNSIVDGIEYVAAAIRSSRDSSSSGTHPGLVLQVGYGDSSATDAIEIYRDQIGGTPPAMRFVGGDGRIYGVKTFTTPDAAGAFQVGGESAALIARNNWVVALQGYFGIAFRNHAAGTYPIEFDWINNRLIFNTYPASFGHTNHPGAWIDLAASTTDRASLRVRAGTAPTTPNTGDIWYPSGGRLSLYRAATEIFATGVQATGGSATAGATWTSTEQTMLQAVYNAARSFGMLS